MNISEILNEIHSENCEVEIYKALSEWIVLDRQETIIDKMKYKAIVRAIGKIANDNLNKKDALEGIKNLCDLD